AQTAPEAVEALGVDLVAGTAGRMAFLDDLEALLSARTGATRVTVDDSMTRRSFELLPAGGLEGRTRAMLKVEDGCVNFCAYCVIPYARGPVRSLPLKDAAAEAARLAGEDYRELVLTGIELSSWGRDLPGRPELAGLVEAVCRAAPGCRVRLGSLEPRTVTEDFCRRCAALPNLCPHFHLSLQSGCDATLKRMNRKYNTARYLQSAALLRAHFPRPGITADLIVGFPGETEAEFAATLAFLRRCGFSALHIFPYSRRFGTPAAEMPDQVPRQEKENRARRAAAAAADLERSWLEGWVGETLPVLFEEEKGGLWRGHAPNYTEVRAPGRDLHNRVLPVEITGVAGTALTGRLAE
uniref:MiaB/RimO family radical SAM methylthiotransferase n=1 Tax=uncultured Intestinimonas sp. TaxID=1689265 RepID=UPI0025D560F0